MQRFDIEVLLGEQLELEIPFTQDEAGQSPLSLTGWTVEVFLHGYDVGENPAVALKEGAGFTLVSASKIKVDTLITAPAFIAGLGHWYVKLVDPTGRPSYPVGGKLSVGNP